jgi:hypothetical protein
VTSPEAIDMTRMVFDVAGLTSGDQTFVGATWVTPHEQFSLFTGPKVVIAPPRAILTAGDTLPATVEIEGPDADIARLLQLDLAVTDPGTLVALPPLDRTTYAASVSDDGGLSATLSPIPFDGYELAEVDLTSSDGLGQHFVAATPTWLAEHADTLELDTRAPGFDDGWRLDATAFFTCLHVTDELDGVKRTTSFCNYN